MTESRGDLSVTALYTSQVSSWAAFPAADLLADPEARRVFRATNVVLGIARFFRPDLPSLPHSLVQRHLLIDRILERSLGQGQPRQILELAAGLSCRGAAFSADGALRYVEVDLPGIVARKRALLERSPEGRAVLARPNFELVSADVETVDLAALRSPERALAVVVEGLFMYLQPKAQRALWSRLRSLFSPGASGVVVFDLVPAMEQPAPGLLGRALEWLMKRFTKGRAFERDQRSRAAVVEELRASGFTSVEVLDPHEVADAYELPFREIRTQQLVFVCRP